MRTTTVDVIQIPTKGPGDVSGLMNLIEAGKIVPKSIRRFWERQKAMAV